MRSASTSPQASRLIGSKSYWFAWRERARARIDALSPRQRQYGILTVLLGSGIALLWIVLSLSNPAPDRQHVDPTVQGNTSVTNVGVLPPGAQLNPVDQWVGPAGRKLAQYETEREEQSRLNKDRQSFETRTMQRFAELEQRLTSAQQGALAASPSTGVNAFPESVQPAQPAHQGQAGPPALSGQPAQSAPFPPSRTSAPFPAASTESGVPPRPPYASATPGLNSAPDMPPGTPSDLSLDSRSTLPPYATPLAAPVISRVSLGAGNLQSPVRGDDAVSDTMSPPRSAAPTAPAAPATAPGVPTVATFLPVSFTRGTLLGGLDAPTGGQSQSNPQPVLIRLSDNSVLPNQFRGEYRDCFVIAAGYGDISSERAYLRTENLSCVRDDGATLEVRIQGTVYGEDGKVGMRGRLVTKQGQMLANALLAGVVSGIGQGLSTSSTSYSSSPLGTTASIDSSADAYRAGIGSGMGRALDRLAQYYIKLAENTFPVIEVDAGREIDVVITKGVRIDVPTPGRPRDASTSETGDGPAIGESRGPLGPSRLASPATRYLETTSEQNN